MLQKHVLLINDHNNLNASANRINACCLHKSEVSKYNGKTLTKKPLAKTMCRSLHISCNKIPYKTKLENLYKSLNSRD